MEVDTPDNYPHDAAVTTDVDDFRPEAWSPRILANAADGNDGAYDNVPEPVDGWSAAVEKAASAPASMMMHERSDSNEIADSAQDHDDGIEEMAHHMSLDQSVVDGGVIDIGERDGATAPMYQDPRDTSVQQQLGRDPSVEAQGDAERHDMNAGLEQEQDADRDYLQLPSIPMPELRSTTAMPTTAGAANMSQSLEFGDESLDINPMSSSGSRLLRGVTKSSSTSMLKGPSRFGNGPSGILNASQVGLNEMSFEEKRYLAMLGYQILDARITPTMEREDYCGGCGIQHPNPDMLDLYPLCSNCHNCLREQNHLRRRFKSVPQEDPMEILMASYGDIETPIGAINITNHLNVMVKRFAKRDRLPLKDTQKFDAIFGGDPSPGKPKQMRIRYRIQGKHGFVTLDVMENNMIPSNILLLVQHVRHLSILFASYGHPKGRSSTGRMLIDVTENVQGLVDLNGGSFLSINVYTPLKRLFGDPCEGYTKDLYIEFDINGRTGYITGAELQHYLKSEMIIETTPLLSPLIFIESATYGITPRGKEDYLKHLTQQLQRIYVLEHRNDMKIPLKPSELRLIKKKDEIIAERAALVACEPHAIDVTEKIQKIAEEQGGLSLKLDRKTFDPNLAFTNPLPGMKKFLDIFVVSHGHDSENFTDENEVTQKGYLRNFILGRQTRFFIPVSDIAQGKGSMQDSLVFNVNNALPLIKIQRALYGNPRDLKQLFDVTNNVQCLVDGAIMRISTDANLKKLFGDPCPGVPKFLRINYAALGFTGALRVRERNDCLVAQLNLGYPPIPDRTTDKE